MLGVLYDVVKITYFLPDVCGQYGRIIDFLLYSESEKFGELTDLIKHCSTNRQEGENLDRQRILQGHPFFYWYPSLS